MLRRQLLCYKIIKMKLLLLLFPALVASIDVEISGKVYFEHKYIFGGYNVRGVDHRPATDNDCAIFHMTYHELHTAVELYYGKKTDHIFFDRHSPYGDVYSMHRWNPVEVKLQADEPELVEMTTENVVLAKRIYQLILGGVNVTESATTYDSVTSLWTNPQQLKGNDVNNVRFYIEAEDGYSSMEHTFDFGVDSRKLSKKIRNQTVPEDFVVTEPYIKAQLEAKKGTLRFRVPYTASLSGVVAVYYKPDYKNSDFHGLDINKILEASQRNTTTTVYQTISYEFYYGQTLKILNYAEDTVIKSYAYEGEISSGLRRKAAVVKHAANTGKNITVKEGTKPFEFTEEELKAVVNQVIENQLNEESCESTERVDTAHVTKKH